MIKRYIIENVYDDGSDSLLLEDGQEVEIIQAVPHNSYVSGIMVTVKANDELFEIDASFLSKD